MNIFKKEQVEHDWEFTLKSHDEKNHKEYLMYRCKACGTYKREYTGKFYEDQKEKIK